jgi:hypothetical protein
LLVKIINLTHMNKIILAFKSRTFWTVVLLICLNTVPELKGLVSQNALDVINGILGLIATYFHVSPSQEYPRS